MKIAGFQANSFVDYKGNIAAVIFFGGCNLNCYYCHNKQIIDASGDIPIDRVYEDIKKRTDFLDGVVLTGGEPTLQGADALLEVINTVKSFGLKVKLDTNGTRPDVLERLLPRLDYIAMDIKAPLDRYSVVTPIFVKDIKAVKQSVALVKSLPEHEFRTTVCPPLTVKDIESIAHEISGAASYYLQSYNPQSPDAPRAYPKEILIEMQQVSAAILGIDKVFLR